MYDPLKFETMFNQFEFEFSLGVFALFNRPSSVAFASKDAF